MPIERRAVRANDFAIVAHVEEYVRVIERRPRPDAHELGRPDLDDRNAGVVLKVGNMLRHDLHP